MPLGCATACTSVTAGAVWTTVRLLSAVTVAALPSAATATARMLYVPAISCAVSAVPAAVHDDPEVVEGSVAMVCHEPCCRTCTSTLATGAVDCPVAVTASCVPADAVVAVAPRFSVDVVEAPATNVPAVAAGPAGTSTAPTTAEAGPALDPAVAMTR